MAKQKFVWLKTTYFGKPDINVAKITCLTSEVTWTLAENIRILHIRYPLFLGLPKLCRFTQNVLFRRIIMLPQQQSNHQHSYCLLIFRLLLAVCCIFCFLSADFSFAVCCIFCFCLVNFVFCLVIFCLLHFSSTVLVRKQMELNLR